MLTCVFDNTNREQLIGSGARSYIAYILQKKKLVKETEMSYLILQTTAPLFRLLFFNRFDLTRKIARNSTSGV